MNFMDINKCCDDINKNVGHKVWMEVKRLGSEKFEEIKGIISQAFSNEPSPVCVIKTEKTNEEIFLGEVRDMKII